MPKPSDEILERFRAVSLDRLGRVEAGWNRVLLDDECAVTDLLREVHTLKGDASIVGETNVADLCRKLEDLLERVDQLRYVISDDLELVVTMAIQFAAMMLRGKQRAVAGLDLAGFVRQVDDVLHESRTLAAEPGVTARGGRSARSSSPPPFGERLADETRRRFAVVATTIFLEGLAAREPASRTRLRDGWAILQHELARLDATAIDPILDRHAAAGRELARALGKQIVIEVEAARPTVRVAPRVAEAIEVALLHVVRNSVDHGIEAPGDRARSGKPAGGTIRIRTSARDGEIELAVEDDGKGIDVAAVRAAATARGIDLVQVSERGVDLVFEPGVSTRSAVTDISGRGVGLDAVRTEIERAGGRVQVRTGSPGTTVTLVVPAVTRHVPVYRFAVPGSTLPLAVSARWTPTMDAQRGALIDPLRALGIGASESRTGPSAQVLRLRWGFLEVAMPASGPPTLATAERICPTPDGHPVEVITIDGTEALLVRPEHLQSADRRTAAG